MYKTFKRPEWGKLATFVPNKKEPVYNWFYYKEGFSRNFALKMIEMLDIRDGYVLDPFCGVGTTLLACIEKGINSIGFDVHPVAVFASKVKTQDYDIDKLRKEAVKILSERFIKPPVLPRNNIIRRAFKKETLEDVLFFRNIILKIQDRKIRDFMMLALMSCAMKCSYVYKDGAVIKFIKKHVPPFRHIFKRQLKRMIKDIESFKRKECETRVEFGDARMLNLADNSVNAVITSPPYLNKIEYTKIYEIEQKLFLDFLQERPPIRSYVGVSFEETALDMAKLIECLGNDRIEELPDEAKPYFIDMYRAISEIFRVCNDNAKVAMIVGNGCFPDRVVESDIILSEIARHCGFLTESITVLNERWCTKHRVQKVGRTRESLLIWKKE